jgi:hypothetical protein
MLLFLFWKVKIMFLSEFVKCFITDWTIIYANRLQAKSAKGKEVINNPNQTNNVWDLPGNSPASTCNIVKNVSALVINALNTSLFPFSAWC